MTSRRTADERLQRLLALVPWVAERDGPLLGDVCARFGCREDELIEDLRQLFVCGLYPYTPDVLIDVDVADGRVWIRYADFFARPLRLTPGEGLVLLAAGQTLLAVPGSDPIGPLARGLAKLGRALGVEGGNVVEISLGGVSEPVMASLGEALSRCRQVQIEYYTFGRDEWTTRMIDPYATFSAGGQWYLSAYCHKVDDERLFRLDRIRQVDILDSGFEPPAAAPELAVFRPRDDDPRVTLELEAGARWVAGQYPVERLEELADGRSRVTLAVSHRAWLDRLLLRLGPAAQVVGDDGRPDPSLVASAAGRVLLRYQDASGSLACT